MSCERAEKYAKRSNYFMGCVIGLLVMTIITMIVMLPALNAVIEKLIAAIPEIP